MLEVFGFAYVAVKVSELVGGLDKGVFRGAKGKRGRYMSRKPEVAKEAIAVAGSPKIHNTMRWILDGEGQRNGNYLHR